MTPRVTNAVLAVKMDNINERIDQLANTVEEHDKMLRGNGNPGLRAGQAAHTKTLNKIEKISWFVVVVVLGDIIARIMNLI